MGLGDWILATGEVKKAYAERKMPVRVVGVDGRPMWSEVFDHNPKIMPRHGNGRHQRLLNGPNARPYIAGKTAERWKWRPYTPIPGELFFTADERSYGNRFKGLVLIEPNTKVADSNKAWPFERWQEVVNRSRLRFVQVGPFGTRWLDGVGREVTTFRHAAAALAHCRAFVGTEGALHHCAAAVNTPAVVLWSHYISPSITGYKQQTNIRHAGEPCGWRVPCAECKASMDRISVDEVITALEEKIATCKV